MTRTLISLAGQPLIVVSGAVSQEQWAELRRLMLVRLRQVMLNRGRT